MREREREGGGGRPRREMRERERERVVWRALVAPTLCVKSVGA